MMTMLSPTLRLVATAASALVGLATMYLVPADRSPPGHPTCHASVAAPATDVPSTLSAEDMVGTWIVRWEDGRLPRRLVLQAGGTYVAPCPVEGLKGCDITGTWELSGDEVHWTYDGGLPGYPVGTVDPDPIQSFDGTTWVVVESDGSLTTLSRLE